jgi:hypothetical protein
VAKQYHSQNQFSGGQLTPRLHSRFDLPAYRNATKVMENWTIQSHGPITNRPGTRFVDTGLGGTANIRLIEFVFSDSDALILEFTAEAVRFYKDGVRLTGTPTLTTPYLAADLDDLQYAQVGNVLFIAHQDYAPRKITRITDALWTIQVINFAPPPTEELGLSSATISLTLSAASGTGITITSSANTFLPTDEDRLVLETNGDGTAIITAFGSQSSVTADVIDTFTSTSLAAGEWTLGSSPLADLNLDIAGPSGSPIVIKAFRELAAEAELVTDGSFTSADPSVNWTDFSAPAILTGSSHISGSRTVEHSSATINFALRGVVVGHKVVNVTDGSGEGTITIIDTFGNPTGVANNRLTVDDLTGGTGNTFEDADLISVFQTGSVTYDLANDDATLRGGVAGLAHIQQSVTTTSGALYQVKFIVKDAPLSLQVGSTSRDSDVVEEATFAIGENKVNFEATSASTFIQFRNNQNTAARLDDVSVKLISASAFAPGDVEKYVVGNGGIAHLTAFVNATEMTGIVRKAFTDDSDISAGTWSLESEEWSAARGFPRTITLFSQRLFYGGTASSPLKVWGSRLGSFEDFGLGTDDDDSVEFQPTSSEGNVFQWMAGENDLLIGTAREEFVATGATGSSTITPTSIQVTTPTRYGSARVRPIRVGNAVVFVQQGAVILRQFVFNEEVDTRTAEDLTILAEDITTSGIRDIAYQQIPDTVIWIVLNDGTLLSATYLRDQNVIGWVKHRTSDGTFKSVAIIPNGSEDQVWFSVERNGANLVEYLGTADGFYTKLQLDSSVVYSGASTTTLTGLTHLEGKTVQVLGNGAVYLDAVVSGGSITVSPAVTRAEVGIGFSPTITTLRPGTERSPTLGLTTNNLRVVLSVLSSINVLVNGERINFRDPPQAMDNPTQLFTGDKVYYGDRGDGDQHELVITQDQPLPITLSAITRLLETSDD